MSVMIYASRWKCDNCGKQADTVPGPHARSAPKPDGWSHLIGDLGGRFDICDTCGAKPFTEVIEAAGLKHE